MPKQGNKYCKIHFVKYLMFLQLTNIIILHKIIPNHITVQFTIMSKVLMHILLTMKVLS